MNTTIFPYLEIKPQGKEIPYQDLEKHFTRPLVISPFYGDIRMPRKLKKKLKKLFNQNFLTLSQKRWWLLGLENPNYVRFLIKQICK